MHVLVFNMNVLLEATRDLEAKLLGSGSRHCVHRAGRACKSESFDRGVVWVRSESKVQRSHNYAHTHVWPVFYSSLHECRLQTETLVRTVCVEPIIYSPQCCNLMDHGSGVY